jgi:hypothetical protein
VSVGVAGRLGRVRTGGTGPVNVNPGHFCGLLQNRLTWPGASFLRIYDHLR